MKNKYLIITADDYGVTPEVSEGIRKSIKDGIVSCTSVMMNYVSPSDIKNLCELREQLDFGIGVHINLTEGKSLTTGQEFEYLMLNRLDFVREEINLQIKRFSEEFGPIDHINFHQHIHYDLRVLQEFLSIEDLKEVPVRYVNKIMKEILTTHNRLIPNDFINVFPLNATSVDFESYLASAVEKLKLSLCQITEWMVHPGYTSPELEALAPKYSKRREVELALICGDELKKMLLENNIYCKSFTGCFK